MVRPCSASALFFGALSARDPERFSEVEACLRSSPPAIMLGLLLLASAAAAAEEAVTLTETTFDDSVARSHTFVKFYAPWCGHCKKLSPVWDQLAASGSTGGVTIARVDMTVKTKHRSFAKEFAIHAFPTLLFFKKGGKKSAAASQSHHPFRLALIVPLLANGLPFPARCPLRLTETLPDRHPFRSLSLRGTTHL